MRQTGVPALARLELCPTAVPAALAGRPAAADARSTDCRHLPHPRRGTALALERWAMALLRAGPTAIVLLSPDLVGVEFAS